MMKIYMSDFPRIRFELKVQKQLQKSCAVVVVVFTFDSVLRNTAWCVLVSLVPICSGCGANWT